MLSAEYKEKAQYDYYRALIAIRDHREQDASSALNAARTTVLDGKYFTSLNDADVQQISEDLKADTFYALYGDYGYKGKSSWVPEKLRGTVETHFAKFE